MTTVPTREGVEWLEPDGLGGYASGTVGGIRTRRYHALLLASCAPPAQRMVLVNGLEAWVASGASRVALTSQRYAPDVVYPDGASRAVAFTHEPWPTWTFQLDDGTEIVHELFVPLDCPAVALSWRLASPRGGLTLLVRPLISGRDFHALHRENPAFRWDAAGDGETIEWRPYPPVPAICALTNGSYTHEPEWYRDFFYTQEAARGLDATEDLASPGTLAFDLSSAEAVLILCASTPGAQRLPRGRSTAVLARLRAQERKRRAAFMSPLHRSASHFLARRGEGRTIIAGYPWFGDWGRDTFIALRGLCLATGRLDDARAILLDWAGRVSQGMLPNCFPEHGADAQYNSVDAPLWYAVAVQEWLAAMRSGGRRVRSGDRLTLARAVSSILAGYAAGTRYGIRVTDDGLLAAGVPGVQLTWMDAKVGDWVVTPRIGKPVEVQALWINALRIGERLADLVSTAQASRWRTLMARAQQSFGARFWLSDRSYLADVVDANHTTGAVDATFRPNQLFAIGGLPFAVVEGGRARAVVEQAEARLWTPLGPRSLAPGEPGYVPRYDGGPGDRDAAYHQGAVWPWLAGAFIEAWVRAHGDHEEARREARTRFLDPLLAQVGVAGLGHLPEIADAEPPHTARGCPFQAWSLGEALRLRARLEQPVSAEPAAVIG